MRCNMTSEQIRKKFLDFFKSKEHSIIPSASLIPSEADPTALFTTAGMHPLAPYLLGENHPGGKRVAGVQKCVRTGDIDEVGDARHLTFFEMLGNWSFGDYFKKDAIEWSFEFLTSEKWLGINPKKISATVFSGDENALIDKESAEIWESLGISKEKISYLGKEDNWWGPVGATGPCGSDTEIFINGIEIWNNVFMQYNKNAEGKYELLKQKNVDTGMGLERIAMIMQGKNNVYETDLFIPIIKKIEQLTDASYKLKTESYRIIADHIKAAVFIIMDGVKISNVGRGYVLRRLIRRALRHGKLLGIGNNFTKKIAEEMFKIYKTADWYDAKKENEILNELNNEENRFGETLGKGLKQFEKISAQNISGQEAFNLFSTYGFPIEMVQELAQEKGIKIDIEGFKKEFQKHQEISKTASAGMFKGGLADAGEQTVKYHTATHLLNQALREVLGKHVVQKGSNITAERLRFDFSHPEKLTDEQKRKVEDLVNEKIKEDLPVLREEMDIEEAKKRGALGAFNEKYGKKVKVYSIGKFSREICGGPHVERTSQVVNFKIIKEESVSAGVRRIKAKIF
ncbi:alanine--tRNA ligase [Candidatus Wolfebacteria bacterium]|nr:alanine--tRNA ligase [Candidatus Wolfebacteria bacterium]